MSLIQKHNDRRTAKGAKKLLDDPRTGLKDSSDTNKTRYAIFGLFEDTLRQEKERLLQDIEGMEKKDSGSSIMGYEDYEVRGYNTAVHDITKKIRENL